ncbi:hypothetical protein M2337_002452 [Sphingobium sp. B2D3A]|uniref:hypothetical protein n=1 Tax=unclassified Sphingobium TaxID=2611147 RepID=UPI002225386A|nr:MULTISPECIES: hypothetical protein [unclassified Sphingobium]MCW2338219.1 hypothetical protein [Sphingobium sp. B2D3A]MCW2384677.1 hypothetical protein [Sphingobium sp. B2D3D]
MTLTLFRADDPAAIVREVTARLDDVALTLPVVPVGIGDPPRPIVPMVSTDIGALHVETSRYRIEKQPSWFRAPDPVAEENEGDATANGEEIAAVEDEYLLDVANHLIVLVAAAPFVALYASHDTMRARLTELIGLGATGEDPRQVRLAQTAMPIEREVLENAFVRGNAKSAWLEGLHVPTILKADRKILSGPDLRYALDQFGDQTYTYTAAVSVLPTDKPEEKKDLRVGVSYDKNTLWTKSTKNFEEFIAGLQELIGVLTGAKADAVDVSEFVRSGLPFVARPLSAKQMADIKEGFDVGYDTAELIDDVVAGRVVEPAQERDAWRSHGRFVVDEAETLKAGGAAVVVDAYYDDRKLATLSMRPVARADRQLEILHRVVGYHVDKADAELAALDRSLGKRNAQMTIRYASGHVIQNGALYQTHFRDAIFERWRWMKLTPADDGMKYDLKAEKPTKPGISAKGKSIKIFDPSKIGLQDSLFCYVKKHAASTGSPDDIPIDDWWLLCDDGAGEIADFIAISPKRPSISFIHVKARHKGEKSTISVTPFSEVVSQAVKNLRAYDQGLLGDMLSGRTTANNDGLVWRHDGTVIDRAAFVTAMNGLRKPQRHVLIFQPRISEKTWDKAVEQHRAGKEAGQVGRMRQLSALLSGAQSTFQKLGASMEVTGEK